MRVNQSQRTAATPSARSARRRKTDATFQPAQSGETRETATLRGTEALGSLDALVTLQTVEDQGERRRRAVREGSEILDRLDALKVALLSGRVPSGELERLKTLVERLDAGALEPELAEIVREIDLRARVELAKLDRSAA